MLHKATLVDPKGGQGMPWHTLSGPPRPTQEHAIGLLLPSPSKRRHADAAEKKKKRDADSDSLTPSRAASATARPPMALLRSASPSSTAAQVAGGLDAGSPCQSPVTPEAPRPKDPNSISSPRRQL